LATTIHELVRKHPRYGYRFNTVKLLSLIARWRNDPFLVDDERSHRHFASGVCLVGFNECPSHVQFMYASTPIAISPGL
jgi:hypothetical protein